MSTVTVRSKTTGLVGQYPASHVELDPDLEIVHSEDEICVDCVLEVPEPDPEPVYVPVEKYTPRKGKKNNG